jgi:hypothetical protein
MKVAIHPVTFKLVSNQIEPFPPTVFPLCIDHKLKSVEGLLIILSGQILDNFLIGFDIIAELGKGICRRWSA